MDRKKAMNIQEGLLPHKLPPSPEQWARLYLPPRSLGATEEYQLAMDAALQDCGFHSLLGHAVSLGMGWEEMAPQFLGYPYLAGLSQNGLIRAGVTTVAEEMTKRWIDIRHGSAQASASGGSDANSASVANVKGDENEDAKPQKGTGKPENGVAKTKNDDKDAQNGKATGKKGGAADKIKVLNAAMEDFGLQALFNEAAQRCDFDGGCLIYVDTGERDEQALARELFLDAALLQGRIKRFTLVEAINLYPGPYNVTDPLAPDYFMPDSWLVLGKRIHKSRFLYFAPNQVNLLLRPAYNFFGIPAAQLALDYVAHFTKCREAAQRLLTKFSLTVFKSNVMSGLLSGGGTGDIDRRMQYLAQHRDNDSILLIDKEEEDVIKLETPLGGATEIVRQSLEFLAAIFRIPFVKFLGISPGGLNATGEADLRNFYDHVAGKQEKMLRPPLKQALKLLQIHLFGEIDPEIRFEFRPLTDEDENQKAQTRKLRADRDATYLDRQVLTRQEVRLRLSQDNGGEYAFIHPAQGVGEREAKEGGKKE